MIGGQLAYAALMMRPGSRRALIGFVHPSSLGGVLMHLVERPGTWPPAEHSSGNEGGQHPQQEQEA